MNIAKAVSNKEVVQYWNNASQEEKQRLYFEVYYGGRPARYLTFRHSPLDNRSKTIFKIRKDVMDKFNITSIESQFINVSVYKIEELNQLGN